MDKKHTTESANPITGKIKEAVGEIVGDYDLVKKGKQDQGKEEKSVETATDQSSGQ